MPFSNVTIDPEVRRVFPQSRVGWLVAGVSVIDSHPLVEEMKENLAAELASRGITDENLASQPDIRAWREVYGAMGVKPSKYRSSLEALAKRVLKGKDMWNVSSVVDCYNCASVSTMLPMGAHDTSRIDGAITLRFGRPGEKFYPLGADGEAVDVDLRNIVYADETKICCWLWNHRDTRLAAVTRDTEEAVFLIDAACTPHCATVEQGLDILWKRLEKIGCEPKEKGIA
jgi:lysyl-tRNA synthetase class 2